MSGGPTRTTPERLGRHQRRLLRGSAPPGAARSQLLGVVLLLAGLALCAAALRAGAWNAPARELAVGAFTLACAGASLGRAAWQRLVCTLAAELARREPGGPA